MRSFHLLLLSIGLLALHQSNAVGQVQLTNAFPALSFTQPIFLTHAGDGSNRIFVVQQDGLIKVFPNDSAVTSATTFLNIRNKLSSTGGEEGLLGLAFHPDYENNGYFYVNYTAPSPLRTVIARYSVMLGNPNKADSLSEFPILAVNQPFSNHNGGMVLFGVDGYLYVGMGDGGSADDPQDHGQTLQSLLGKVLRIDVDTTVGQQNYGIPEDNPFAGNPAAGQEEIYAWGFRNPWRFSEDAATGLLLLADVGQNIWEEVDDVRNGLNYGWRCYEGNVPHNTNGCGPIGNYTFPIKVYSHSGGNCSATGGYIYRGYRKPEFTGAYIYGDYCSGRIWLLRYENGQVLEDELLINSPFTISSFGVDQDGELYVCNYGGNIQRFVGPPLSGIACSDIAQFQTRCRPGGIIQARVTMTDNSHTGEVVEVSIDQVPFPVTIGVSGRGSLSQSGFSAGDHTVELTDPPSCFAPNIVRCPAGLANGEDDLWDDDFLEIEASKEAPVVTALLGSYPNPFNPTTAIRYQLSSVSDVSLVVYDVLGREVATLVDGVQEAGEHSVILDGSRLASGVYYYRLLAGSFSDTGRLILTK